MASYTQQLWTVVMGYGQSPDTCDDLGCDRQRSERLHCNQAWDAHATTQDFIFANMGT